MYRRLVMVDSLFPNLSQPYAIHRDPPLPRHLTYSRLFSLSQPLYHSLLH
jgi:hypothetical protein